MYLVECTYAKIHSLHMCIALDDFYAFYRPFCDEMTSFYSQIWKFAQNSWFFDKMFQIRRALIDVASSLKTTAPRRKPRSE